MPRLLYFREYEEYAEIAPNFVKICLKKMYALNPSGGNIELHAAQGGGGGGGEAIHAAEAAAEARGPGQGGQRR